jgi:predicted porin
MRAFLCTRQAYIGFSNDRYGTFTLGWQYTPYFQLVGALGATDVHPRDVDSPDTTLRFNNSVTYLSPNVADVRFSAVTVVGDWQNTTPSWGPSQLVGMMGLRHAF